VIEGGRRGTEVSISAADRAFNADGDPVDRTIADRLMLAGRQVARFARLHTCGQYPEFMKEMEEAAVDQGVDSPTHDPADSGARSPSAL